MMNQRDINNEHVHMIGRADAFAARNTEMYLNVQTGEVFYFPLGQEHPDHTISVMVGSDPKVQKLVRQFYKRQKQQS